MSQGTQRGGIAEATRHVLHNGMVAQVLRTTGTPTVSLRGEVRVGAALETAAQSGLAAFTGDALIRGAGARSYQQIVAETEERGCSVSTWGGMHTSGWSGKCLSEDLALVLEILADMLIRPTFPAHEVEKLRGQILMSLQEEAQDTGAQASRAIHELLYPTEHPYSRSSSGTPETVQQIHSADMAAFHRFYHPALASIAIVGDIEPAAAVSMLEQYFGAWRGVGEPARPILPPIAPLTGVQRRTLPMAGKVQADLIWAVHGLRRDDPHYYPAMLANMILGQLGMGGRLGEHVREEQGMAYYCYSSLEADLGAGPWAAAAGVSPENLDRAITGILDQIAAFCADGPSDDELADVRDYLTGSMVLGLETNDGIAATLLAIDRYGLGSDYIERYPALIRGVTREQIVEAARSFLSTENYVLAVAGPVG